MQRTVHIFRFTYAKNTLNDDGTINSELRKIDVMETNEEKALKKAQKAVKSKFEPLKVEMFTKLYFMDDDFFIANAVPMDECDPTPPPVV